MMTQLLMVMESINNIYSLSSATNQRLSINVSNLYTADEFMITDFWMIT